MTRKNSTRRHGELKLITRHGRGPWFFKRHDELYREAKKKYKVTKYLEYVSLQNAIDAALKAWSSDQGRVIRFSWFTYPNTR
jgi:hypothetical protein